MKVKSEAALPPLYSHSHDPKTRSMRLDSKNDTSQSICLLNSHQSVLIYSNLFSAVSVSFQKISSGTLTAYIILDFLFIQSSM